MKNGWQKKNLAELCQIKTGKKDVNEGNPNGKYPFFTCAAKHTYSDSYSFDTEALLIAGNGDVGNVSYYKGKFEAYQRTYVLFGFIDVLPRFLFLILDGKLKETVSKQKLGNTMPYIKVGMLTDFEVPLPSLQEQHRIVAILDKAFAAIATARTNAEQNLKNARELFESHLQQVFSQKGEGWVERSLSDLSRINYGYTESANWKRIGPRFLRITDIQDNQVDWGKVPYCSIDKDSIKKYKLLDGDIVFARTGATTGKSYLVKNPPDAVFASYLIRVQLNDTDLIPDFLNLFFQSHTYWDSIRAGVSGSAQGGFNASKLGELVIPFPKNKKQQCEIVARLGSVSSETQRLTSLYQQKITALDELKKSLLHQAFSGAL